MNGVLDLAVCVLAMIVAVGILHWVIARPRRAGGRAPANRSTIGRTTATTSAADSDSAGCVRHRWSQPRPRLRLTGSGLRDAGQRIRFCLDCAAEKTDDEVDPGWGGTIVSRVASA